MVSEKIKTNGLSYLTCYPIHIERSSYVEAQSEGGQNSNPRLKVTSKELKVCLRQDIA